MRPIRWTSVSLWFLALALIIATAEPARGQIFFITGIRRVRAVMREITLPPGPVNIQVSEAAHPPRAPDVIHNHAAAWGYAIAGLHLIAIGGKNEFTRGEFWIPAGVEHTHGWDPSEQNRFLELAVGTNLSPEAPSGFRTLGVTPPLPGIEAGTHEVWLVRFDVPRESPNISLGQALDDRPGVLVVLEGSARYRDRAMQRGEVLLLTPPVGFLGNVPNERPVVLHLFVNPKR